MSGVKSTASLCYEMGIDMPEVREFSSKEEVLAKIKTLEAIVTTMSSIPGGNVHMLASIAFDIERLNELLKEFE